MSFYSIELLNFDGSDIAGSHNVGVQIHDGTNLVGVTSNALDVNIAAAAGLAIYAEDSAHTTGEDLQAVGLVRQDALSASTGTDGDYGNFKSTSKGELYVKATDSDAILTTIDADTGAILSDTNAMVVDLAAIEALLITIDSDTGLILADTNAMVVDLAAIEVLLTQIDVDTSAIAVSVASIDTDTSTIAGDTTSMDATLTALSIAEDSASSGGEQGIQILAVRNDVEGSLVTTDGDFAPIQVDALGRVRVIGDLDVVGNVADDAADSGNPLKVGSRSHFGSALAAISTTNDRADLLSDEFRRLHMNGASNVGSTLSKPTINATAAQIAASPQSGRLRMIISNESTEDIFVGPDNTVTTATGIPIRKKSIAELDFGEELAIWAIKATAAASDVRVWEHG